MFKNYAFLLSFALAFNCFAQTNLSTNGVRGNSNNSVSLFSGLKVTEYHTNFDDREAINGSPYLFKNWTKKAKVWYNDTVFHLDSVNYNLENESFEIKQSEDSIFIISPTNNIKKIEIDNTVFKPYVNNKNGTKSFYEVLWNDDNFSLLSKYRLKIKGGSIDPLTKAYLTPKEYTSEKEYYILRHNEEEQMVAIKMKKSYVLKLVEDSYIDRVKGFIKKQKLKYNNISDIKKILIYYYSIKS